MSYEHNLMAHAVSVHLLSEVRNSRAGWANNELGERTTLWQGMAEWPRPDIAFQDTTKNVSIAFEFKPPNQPKREYVTGIGQTLTYLSDFKFAGLILPSRANDGSTIAEYIGDMFKGLLAAMPVAIFEYEDDPAQLKVIRRLQSRPDCTVSIPVGIGRRVFWGYWRDLSNHDLLEMLRITDLQLRPNFATVFDKFWSRFLLAGEP